MTGKAHICHTPRLMFREICWVKPKLRSWTHTVYIQYVETHWVTVKFSSLQRIPCLGLGWEHCVRVVVGLRIGCSWSRVNTTVDWVPRHAEFFLSMLGFVPRLHFHTALGRNKLHQQRLFLPPSWSCDKGHYHIPSLQQVKCAREGGLVFPGHFHTSLR